MQLSFKVKLNKISNKELKNKKISKKEKLFAN